MEEHTEVLITIVKRDDHKFLALFANGESWWLSRQDVAESERQYVDIVADGEALSLLVRTERLRELGLLRS